jgi:hypothetical protein
MPVEHCGFYQQSGGRMMQGCVAVTAGGDIIFVGIAE